MLLQAKLSNVIYLRLSIRLGRYILCAERKHTPPYLEFNKPHTYYSAYRATNTVTDNTENCAADRNHTDSCSQQTDPHANDIDMW